MSETPAPTDPISAPAEPQGAAASTPVARTIVLVGLMGAGKTAVGQRLARSLGLPFVDADDEIEAAAGMTIADIFQVYGEPAFRDLERRVVARLLEPPIKVLALGGGAFVDPATRARVRARALSIWLRCDVDLLVDRTNRRRGVRPLIARGDARATLAHLLEQRGPAYGEADLAVDSGNAAVDTVVARIRALLDEAGTAR